MTSAEENARLNTAEIISAPSAEPEKKMRNTFPPSYGRLHNFRHRRQKLGVVQLPEYILLQYNLFRASPTTLALVDSLCGIADAIDNAISGPIIDRTRTRWGRVRPYLVATLPLDAVRGDAVALPTNLSQTALFFILLILQYLGSIANSFYGPLRLFYNLTPNVDERDRLIAAVLWTFSAFGFHRFPVLYRLPAGNIPTRYIYIGRLCSS